MAVPREQAAPWHGGQGYPLYTRDVVMETLAAQEAMPGLPSRTAAARATAAQARVSVSTVLRWAERRDRGQLARDSMPRGAMPLLKGTLATLAACFLAESPNAYISEVAQFFIMSTGLPITVQHVRVFLKHMDLTRKVGQQVSSRRDAFMCVGHSCAETLLQTRAGLCDECASVGQRTLLLERTATAWRSRCSPEPTLRLR